MDKTLRHQVILNEVQIHNRVLLTDLAHILQVSIDTVRRDLKELDEAGQLKRVHGGAVSLGFNTYNQSQSPIYAYESKAVIAKKGITLLQKGDVVLISGGTTHIELARLLPPKMDLTFFTPSLPMAIELLNSPHNYEVILIGGKLSKSSQLATGGSVINLLSELKADICFLGTGYLDPIQGITEIDWEIAQMKKAMISASKKVVSLTISEKLNTTNRYKICDINTLDVLVTELNPNDQKLEAYRRQGIQII